MEKNINVNCNEIKCNHGVQQWEFSKEKIIKERKLKLNLGKNWVMINK